MKQISEERRELMESRHEKIIRLSNKMCQNELTITPDTPEYQLLDYVLEDEDIDIMLAMSFMVPMPAPAIAAKAKKSVKETHRILEKIADIGIILDTQLNKHVGKLYTLPPFAPGIFEFLVVRDKFIEEHPKVAELFAEHCIKSYEEVAAETPMGVGVMRVVPIETALPVETKKLTMERISNIIETAPGGNYALMPCQCRRTRRMMGEATGEVEDGLCLYMGIMAESVLRHGVGVRLTKEQAYEHMRKTEAMGCVHQVTTVLGGLTLAICNCKVETCLALGASRYYNTPAMSRSNYVSEVDETKCVACGQCVEMCPGNALKLGQKICSKTPIVHTPSDLPDEMEWGPEKYNPDYRDNRENVVETGSSPCKATCPAHISIQGYLKLAAQGKFMEALELIKKENPLPAVCGRICPHNCESECTRGNIDKPIAIDEVKKFIADREIEAAHRFIPDRIFDYDKKVAVIGSGPAGISCAYYLAAGGYKVTVFEKALRPGGMLMNGIPGFRLEKDVVDAEIDVLRAMGVRFKCGVEVGKDITIPELREQGYEAFYLGIGLQDCGKLNIPGDDAAGVIGGVDFLKDINKGNDVKLSGKVVVIGGGSIGSDVARTAKRYGADQVDLYCLEDYDNMPMGEEDKSLCNEDGIILHPGWGQTEIVKKAGKVAGIKFHKCLSVKNEEGRFDPKFDDAVVEMAECGTVLFCIGQKPEWNELLTGVNVELNARGFVIADPLTYQTSEPDIFAGGDIYTGQKFCIDAIAAGKQGAESIGRFVWEGHDLKIGRNRREFKALDKEDLDYNAISYDNIGRQVPGIKKANIGSKHDERITFTEEQVRNETARCLGCGATIVDENRCIGCGVCTTRCKFDAIHLVKKFDAPTRSVHNRKKYIENYRKERNDKIAIKKISK